jgi:hypothetical protein
MADRIPASEQGFRLVFAGRTADELRWAFGSLKSAAGISFFGIVTMSEAASEIAIELPWLSNGGRPEWNRQFPALARPALIRQRAT